MPSRNAVVRRIEDIFSYIKRQLEAKGADFEFLSLACNESTDISDTAHFFERSGQFLHTP